MIDGPSGEDAGAAGPDWQFDGIRVWNLPRPPGTPAEPLARRCLATALGVVPDLLPLARDDSGRPRLDAPCAGYDANWSHSGKRLLLALGQGVRLGIDVEHVRPRPRVLALARRYFHPDEAEWLHRQAADAQLAAFLRLWCAKEALLKAHGRGLAFGLDKLRLADGGDGLRLAACDAGLGAPDDWSLREWAPQPGYHAALAWRRR